MGAAHGRTGRPLLTDPFLPGRALLRPVIAGRQEASGRLDVIVAREAQQTLRPSALHFFPFLLDDEYMTI